MRTTIRDVAARAGVSAMTVSCVLNGQEHRVAAATRERILKVVEELNYVPVAQPTVQRRRGQTRVIGLVFDQLDEVRDYVGVEIYLGMRDAARRQGYDLLTLLREGPEWAGERDEVRFLDRRSDGFIFVNPFRRQGLQQKLVGHEIPLVSCSHDAPEGVARIGADVQQGAALLIEHLTELGHRNIGFVAGPRELGAEARKDAFLRELQRRGLSAAPENVFAGTDDETWRSDRDALMRSLHEARSRRLTALVCANDFIAINLAKVAAREGVSVPGDLAVTGMDDVPLAREQGITTLHHPFAEMGMAAIDAMVALLKGESAAVASRKLPVSLVVRGSTVAGA